MYNDFANIYDLVMRDTPYDDWVAYYKAVFEKYNKNPRLILDMGCGTGNITTKLAAEGYDMIGLDASVSMLSHAREKNSDILYLHMDMTDLAVRHRGCHCQRIGLRKLHYRGYRYAFCARGKLSESGRAVYF